MDGNRFPSIRDEVAMRKVMIFALALLCVPAGLFGQALHPDSLFPRLIGHWVLRGTIARRQTVHDVTFEWLLGREYVQMHEVSRARASGGTPTYEAVVPGHRPRLRSWRFRSLPVPLHRDRQLPHDLRV